MIVAVCQHENRRTNGKTRSGKTRYRCKDCGKSWTESTDTLGGMRIGVDQSAKIIQMLCEGVSVRATARLSGTSLPTVLDLLTFVGERCEAYMQENIRDVFADDVQVDEIWQFVFCKARTAERKRYAGGVGDSYCFTAIERHTKLLLAWHLGRRNRQHTFNFMRKLANATTGRFHLSSDGWRSYPIAVWECLRDGVDFGTVAKVFGATGKEDQRKYLPAAIIGCIKTPILGNSDKDKICTSHCERMNGSIRSFVKRMGRLTYCFSKRWDNHRAALGLFFAHYNYCRKHSTLKGQTPAMAHGLTVTPWSVRELIEKACED